jgi:hypothetical protein
MVQENEIRDFFNALLDSVIRVCDGIKAEKEFFLAVTNPIRTRSISFLTLLHQKKI